MTANYAQFLATKHQTATPHGTECTPTDVNPYLFSWQRRIVAWAVRTGRAAIWADTGLGKTVMQLEWMRLTIGTDGTGLIIAPLAVTQQTIREATKLGTTVTYVRDQDQITGPGIWITNYEMVSHFNADTFQSVALDEASILKQHTGKTRTRLIEQFAGVPSRLSCTATPAPNDPEELTSQAEFLGRSSRVNMLSAYFVHDSDGWRLKGHASSPMFMWMATWAIAIRKPSDLGHPDGDYVLPGLDIQSHHVRVPIEQEGQLFPTDLGGIGGRSKVRRATLDARCDEAARIVNSEPGEPWLIWCGLNDEADRLAQLITGSVNVKGALTPEQKADAFLGFADGQITHMITKPSLAAHGMNWQHCARMVFVGLNDSYESYYQAIRRCYRYGQTRVVDVHIVLSELESQIAANVRRKESEAAMVAESMVNAMKEGSTW